MYWTEIRQRKGETRKGTQGMVRPMQDEAGEEWNQSGVRLGQSGAHNRGITTLGAGKGQGCCSISPGQGRMRSSQNNTRSVVEFV